MMLTSLDEVVDVLKVRPLHLVLRDPPDSALAHIAGNQLEPQRGRREAPRAVVPGKMVEHANL